MSLEMVVLLTIVSVIGTAITAIRATIWWSSRHRSEDEATLLNATELLQQQELEAEIRLLLSEAMQAIDRAISKVNSAPRISNTAALKAAVLSVETKASSLKSALRAKVLKTGGTYLFEVETTSNGGNSANTSSAGSKINAAMKKAEPFRRVSFKEMVQLLRERDASIKSIEDFQKASPDRQDFLLNQIVDIIAKKGVASAPSQGDIWAEGGNGTTVTVITPPASY